jgi:hypothetical protein
MNLTIFPNDDENIMKRMYNKPNTEILDLKGENLMDGLTLSPTPGTGGGGGGATGAPRRGTPID